MWSIASVSLFFFQSCVVTVFGSCPSGWTIHEQSCYHISRETASWAEAAKLCEIHGSRLASIETDSENQFVKNFLAADRLATRVWLGGSDFHTEGEWKWSPDETAFSFTNWHHGQPDNAGKTENCLAVHRTIKYEWSDDHCNLQHYYLCEKPKQSYLAGRSQPCGSHIVCEFCRQNLPRKRDRRVVKDNDISPRQITENFRIGRESRDFLKIGNNTCKSTLEPILTESG